MTIDEIKARIAMIIEAIDEDINADITDIYHYLTDLYDDMDARC